jgi:hypothetical protein
MPPRKKAAADRGTSIAVVKTAAVVEDAKVSAQALLDCIAEYEKCTGANKENDNEVLAKITKKMGKDSGPETDSSLLGLGFKSLAVMYFNRKNFSRAEELFGRGVDAFTRCDMGLKVHVCMHLRAKSTTNLASDPARTDQVLPMPQPPSFLLLLCHRHRHFHFHYHYHCYCHCHCRCYYHCYSNISISTVCTT